MHRMFSRSQCKCISRGNNRYSLAQSFWLDRAQVMGTWPVQSTLSLFLVIQYSTVNGWRQEDEHCIVITVTKLWSSGTYFGETCSQIARPSWDILMALIFETEYMANRQCYYYKWQSLHNSPLLHKFNHTQFTINPYAKFCIIVCAHYDWEATLNC